MTSTSRNRPIRAGSIAIAIAATILALCLLPDSQALAASGPPQYSKVEAPPKLPAGTRLIGNEPSGASLRIDVVLKPRDPQALAQFATAVSTPGNPDYRHFVPRGEVGPEFGATNAVVAEVESALRQAGLSPGPVSSNGLLIPVLTTAGQAESAFRTGINQYRLSTGRLAYANTTAPSLPASVVPSVEAVIGLDDLLQVEPQLEPSGPTSSYAPPGSGPRALPTLPNGAVPPALRRASKQWLAVGGGPALRHPGC